MSITSPDKVYTITMWYDGAREGVADFQGHPHYYVCLWDYDHDGQPAPYQLTPIDDDTFKLELEDWAIWLRYEAAFKAGKASHDSHPALPEDWPRHREITHLLQAKAAALPASTLVATGIFQYDALHTTVNWTPLAAPLE